MTDISASAPTGYMTDGEILAWLEEKSAQQYGDVRDLMNASNERGELMKDLAGLKADIDADKPAGALEQEMQAVRDKYKGTPFEGEVDSLLVPMQGRLDSYMGQPLPDGFDSIDLPLAPEVDLDLELDPAALANTVAPFKDEFSTKIQAEVDQLGRLDQVGLVQIQSDINDAQQTAQLASSLIASGDRTMNTIIGNYRG